MAKPPKATSRSARRSRGFEPASGLLRERIGKLGESRGFAVSRLLTHWTEVVGAETARLCRPVKVGYRQGGLGATLTVLTTGAQAPLLEMQKERLREKVNACYGYNAISRIHITQTAPQGFAEGQAVFEHAPKPAAPPPDPAIAARAAEVSSGISDTGLRQALENLAQNVLNRTQEPKG